MHTTGTTTPEGVHTLAPGMGERRPMAPPSGGHFTLPGGTATEPQTASSPAETPRAVAQPEVPVHVAQQAVAPAPHVPLPPEYGQTATSQSPASTHAARVALPPAPRGYQSAPAGVPAGMVGQAVVHNATGVGLAHASPLQRELPPVPTHVPYVLPPSAETAPAPMPYQAGVHVPQPTAAPAIHEVRLVDGERVPPPGYDAPALTLRIEGPQPQLEAAIGMLMMRGLRVTVV